jgi:cell wall assembly regulator SMI1
VLTRKLLGRLERCWAGQGVPWLDALRPGATDEQLDAVLAPFDRAIPTELRLWWGWHNGSTEDVWIAHDLSVMSAEQAVRDFEMMREIGRGVDHSEKLWSPLWLPVFATGSSPTYAVECAEREPHQTGLVIYQDAHSYMDAGLIAAASLGDVVHRLCEAYDAGLQRWDTDQNRWAQTRWGERRPLAF